VTGLRRFCGTCIWEFLRLRCCFRSHTEGSFEVPRTISKSLITQSKCTQLVVSSGCDISMYGYLSQDLGLALMLHPRLTPSPSLSSLTISIRLWRRKTTYSHSSLASRVSSRWGHDAITAQGSCDPAIQVVMRDYLLLHPDAITQDLVSRMIHGVPYREGCSTGGPWCTL